MIKSSFVKKTIHFIETKLLKFIGLKRPLPLQLDLTNACNLSCKHCYHDHHKNSGNLETADYLAVLRQYNNVIRAMGYSGDVLLCGGEPLLSKHLPFVLKEIAEKYPQFRVGILTNGTVVQTLSPSTQALFKRLKRVDFQVSLDGPNAESHDLIRGIGSFDRAIQGIRFLQRSGFSVHILSVLSSRTTVQIEYFFKLARELSINSLGFTRFIPVGIGKNIQTSSRHEKTLLGHALKQAYQQILICSARYKVRTNLNLPLMNLILPGLGRSGRFFEGIVIDYQGYILASSRSRIKLGHIAKEGLATVLMNHTVFKTLRSPDKMGCGSCTQFKVCGGDRNVAYALTGNYFAKDPGCWI
jgi:radical SAM protein with 4Fe4S-binding SPASM domain